jgi:hypothetical protein
MHYFQVDALLGTLELHESAKHKGSFCSIQLFGAWSYRIQLCIREKLQLVPDGNTRTIQHSLHNLFPGAPSDRRQGSRDGCRTVKLAIAGKTITRIFNDII